MMGVGVGGAMEEEEEELAYCLHHLKQLHYNPTQIYITFKTSNTPRTLGTEKKKEEEKKEEEKKKKQMQQIFKIRLRYFTYRI